MKKPLLAAALFFGLVVFGCTSLLGDFEVSGTGSSGTNCTGPNCTPEGCNPGQSKCGDVCVDTQTSTANCGACNRACPAGLACGAGNCQCPDQGAFCDGQCFAKTDRAHCGVTCSACAGNQVCDGKCSDPPPPAFDKVPRSATGWTDGAGTPLTVTLKPTGQPGTKYECRSAPADKFAGAGPAWVNCDGATGEGTTHKPAEDAATPEGTYITAYRYTLGPYTSPEIRTRYYVHKSLNGVATCPRQGVPIDGPHFTDEQYFAAAKAFSTANAVEFPTTTQFPVSGENRTDELYLGNPWIKIPFTNISRTYTMNNSQGYEDDAWPAAGGNYLFNERSLRHKWVLSADRSMILVARQYIHPQTNDCKQRYEVGNAAEVQFGPPGRARRKLECEAYILNTRGNAICLMPDGAKPDPAVAAFDGRIPKNAGASLVPTFTVYNNQNYIMGSAAPVIAVGGYVQIPDQVFGRWYKIQQVSGNYVYLTENYIQANQAGVKVRYSDAPPVPAYVIGTGYAKLHQDAHSWATGAKKIPAITGTQITQPLPSHRTKCETLGCNAGKPWLTYLPP